jgi:hypothetical protein
VADNGLCLRLQRADLGKAQASKNPEASAAWLNKWGIVFRIGGPIMAVPSGI